MKCEKHVSQKQIQSRKPQNFTYYFILLLIIFFNGLYLMKEFNVIMIQLFFIFFLGKTNSDRIKFLFSIVTVVIFNKSI